MVLLGSRGERGRRSCLARRASRGLAGVERRHRPREVRKRQMADFHRLHADNEGVDERPEEQQGCGCASDCRIPPREMNRVCDPGGRVQEQREGVQRDVGA